MNDYHSKIEWKYRKRFLAGSIRNTISEIPVVVLTGARQVGKSTLLMNEKPFSEWKYLSLDDFDVLEQVREDPITLISAYDHLVIDEVQKAGNLINAIKLGVDKGKGKYILSGSANMLLMSKISESLAGRVSYLVLYPMTKREIEEKAPPVWFHHIFDGKLPEENTYSFVDPLPFILKGFMPPLIYTSKKENVLRWWEGYVATYLERDLRALSNVSSLTDFRKVMTALALRTGNLVNQTEIARDTGISQPTVYRYINLLEVGHIIFRVSPFFPNRTKRIIKSPKIYWVDPALPGYLSGYYDIESLKNARELGSLFENLIFLHLKVLCEQMTPKTRIYYYREVNQKEVDFVLEYGKNLIAIEVKSTRKPHFTDTKGLRYFINEYPETKAGLLIHSGNETVKFGNKIAAIPWALL